MLRVHGMRSGKKFLEIPRVFELGETKEGYVELQHGEFKFRAEAKWVRKLDVQASFDVGDPVIVNETGERATVRMLDWHVGRKAIIYLLNKQGRKSKGWYFDRDLSRDRQG